MGTSRIRWLFLALLLLVSAVASAEAPALELALELAADSGRVPLSGHVALYRDLSGNMSLGEALEEAGHHGFQAVPGRTVASGFMPGALWLRFTLARPATAPAHWWLEVDGFAEKIELYVPRPDGDFDLRVAGSEQGFAERAVKYTSTVFPLVLPAAAPQTFYARIPIDGARRLRLHLWQPEDFQRASLGETLLQGGYFGAILLLVALNLGYWAWQRAPLHGWYAANVLVIALYFFTFDGYLGILLDLAPGQALALARIAVSLWPATNAALMSRLLHLDRHLPRTDRFFRSLFNGLALLAVLAVLSGNFSQMAAVMNLARMLAPLSSLILTLLLLRRGVREAGLYLAAFGFLLLALILISLEQHGLVLAHWNLTNDDLLQAATLPHVIVMYLMVARRFSRLNADRLRAERELLLQQEQQQEQSRFLSLLAHEIRNPLAVVDGAAQLLDLSGQADPRQIERIRAGTGRIADLLKNCLSSERIGSAGWQLDFSGTDLREIIHAARAGHPSARHEIHCRLDGLPERLTCDPTLIRILLDNLLDNAIKYSPEGGGIEILGRLEADAVVLDVADQGVGIAPEEAEKVFRRFYRARQVADVAGAGLGLSMVRRIAELHGGGVTCVSVPGQGTRMSVRLPIP